MHNPFTLARVALALSAAAAIGCSSSTSAPKNSPEGGLWVANQSYDTLPEFSTNQLVTSGTVAPAVRLLTQSDCATGLALDASGNMWESDCDSDHLVEYSPAARNGGGDATPMATITSPTLTSAEQMAFDSHGNLWVTNCGDNILEFTAAQLTAGGNQTPTVAISSSSIEDYCPWGIAFDASGNAWVADDDNAQVVEYSVTQLASSGDKVPAKVISSSALRFAAADVFDGNGNMWVANDEGESVVEFTAAQVAAGGSVTPNAIVTLTGSDPFGLAFDKHGSLWVSDDNNGAMISLTSSQLVTGTPTPSITLASTLESFSPEQPLFDPYATTKGVAAFRVGRSPAGAAGTVRVRRRNHHHKS